MLVQDCRRLIIERVRNPVTYAKVSQCNKEFHEIMENRSDKYDIIDPILSLAWQQPKIKWPWGLLSRGPNFSTKFLERFYDMGLDWLHLSSRVSIDYIVNNPQYQWDWEIVTARRDATTEIMDKYCERPWYLENTACRIIPYSVLIRNLPSLHEALCSIISAKADLKFITEFADALPWIWQRISFRMDLTLEFIEKHASLLNVRNMSNRPFITWDFIQRHPDISWNWSDITKNPNITWEIITNNLNYPWVLRSFSDNPNITWQIVRDNRINWDWNALTRKIPICDIMNNLGANWNWRALAYRLSNK